MQELFDLYYLYDYKARYTVDEEHIEYVKLRDYVASLIERIY